MKKRILTLLTVIAILAGIAVPVRAEETVQEEAVECLTEMPYEALPEEDFEFDEASRTITAYIGTSVDVIIPRTIGGVPVENISYNAFECARDYVHSDMATNQKEGEWLPMRCLILPET